VEPSAILNLVKPTAEGFIEHKDLLQIFIIFLWYALRGIKNKVSRSAFQKMKCLLLWAFH
jgi:hypothetical protein